MMACVDGGRRNSENDVYQPLWPKKSRKDIAMKASARHEVAALANDVFMGNPTTVQLTNRSVELARNVMQDYYYEDMGFLDKVQLLGSRARWLLEFKSLETAVLQYAESFYVRLEKARLLLAVFGENFPVPQACAADITLDKDISFGNKDWAENMVAGIDSMMALVQDIARMRFFYCQALGRLEVQVAAREDKSMVETIVLEREAWRQMD